MNFLLASEDSECIALTEAIDYMYPAISDLFYHIANGGGRSKREGKKLKQMGVRRGIPDYFLSLARGIYHGCYIEVKRKEDWKITKEQIDKITKLRAQGYYVDVAEGCDEALWIVRNYMILKENESLTVKFMT
jgi:VRR-NUC domain-containing protein